MWRLCKTNVAVLNPWWIGSGLSHLGNNFLYCDRNMCFYIIPNYITHFNFLLLNATHYVSVGNAGFCKDYKHTRQHMYIQHKKANRAQCSGDTGWMHQCWRDTKEKQQVAWKNIHYRRTRKSKFNFWNFATKPQHQCSSEMSLMFNYFSCLNHCGSIKVQETHSLVLL